MAAASRGSSCLCSPGSTAEKSCGPRPGRTVPVPPRRHRACAAPAHTGRVSSLGGAKSSLSDTKSSLGDAKSSLGDAKSSLGDTKSSLGDTKSSLRTGVLQRRIDWAALTGDTGRTREEERAKLIAELHQGGVREVPSPSPCCPTP